MPPLSSDQLPRRQAPLIGMRVLWCQEGFGLGEQSVANLDLGPVAVQRLRLVEEELGGVIEAAQVAATTS